MKYRAHLQLSWSGPAALYRDSVIVFQWNLVPLQKSVCARNRHFLVYECEVWVVNSYLHHHCGYNQVSLRNLLVVPIVCSFGAGSSLQTVWEFIELQSFFRMRTERGHLGQCSRWLSISCVGELNRWFDSAGLGVWLCCTSFCTGSCEYEINGLP